MGYKMTYCKQQMHDDMHMVNTVPADLTKNPAYDRIKRLKKLSQKIFIENFKKRHKFREG